MTVKRTIWGAIIALPLLIGFAAGIVSISVQAGYGEAVKFLRRLSEGA